MNGSPEDRAPLVIAMAWASRVMAIAAEMVVPGLIGIWVDQRLGTKVVFTILGFVLGLVAGMWHLIRLTASDTRKTSDPKRPGGPQSK